MVDKVKLFKSFYLRMTAIMLLLLISGQLVYPSPNSNPTIHFTGKGPHLNQNLYLRVVEKGTMKETGRIMQQITISDFDIVLNAIAAGKSYFIDLFSDHNSNGLYDAPPVDHAWRLELDNALGNDELNFAHNTNFTDIQWPNASSVNQIQTDGLVSYQLYQNYPNPFNPTTKIKFNLGSKEFVTLKVFNILGNEIAMLINSDLDAGSFEVEFSAKGGSTSGGDTYNLPSGVYFYTLSTENFSSTRKMLLTQ